MMSIYGKKLVLFVALVLASFIASGEERTVWRQGHDYVAVKHLAVAQSEAMPVALSAERISQLLAGIRYESNSELPDLLGYSVESATVFSERQAQRLASLLHTQFSQLSAGEVITFSVSEIAPQLLGLGGKPVTTSGMVFFADGAIQLIVGELQVNLKKRYIRAGYPIQNGRYPTPAELATFRLSTGDIASKGPDAWRLVADGEFYKQVQSNWIRIPVEAIPTQSV